MRSIPAWDPPTLHAKLGFKAEVEKCSQKAEMTNDPPRVPRLHLLE